MPLTLQEVKALSQDKLTDVVVDEFLKSPIMSALTFDNTVKPQGGKTLAYAYNRITTQPSAGARLINGEYSAQETKTTQKVVNLKIMGGAYEVDRVIANDETQVVSHIEFQSAQKSKATVAEFHNQFINGDSTAEDGSSVNLGEFDGLEKTITGSTTITPDSSIDLSTATSIKSNYGEMLYSLRKLVGRMDESPTHLLMNKDLHSVFQALSDIVPNINFSRDELGNEIGHYGSATLAVFGDKPGTTTPIIETDAAAGTTTLYAVRLGMDGVHGVSPDGNDIIKTYLPDMQAPGAVKKGEVEFVGAIAIKATKSAGKLEGIQVLPSGGSSN